MRTIFLSLILFIVGGCFNSKNPVITIKTELGNIDVELYKDRAPLTIANFELYIDKHLFNGGYFYRTVTNENQPGDIIKIEVIQGGLGWDDNLPRLSPVAHENTQKTNLLHKAGVISMARNEPGSASSEFFICIKDEPELDYGGKRNADGQGFAAFGQVIKGMDVVLKIHNLPDTNQFLENPVKILSIERKVN